MCIKILGLPQQLPHPEEPPDFKGKDLEVVFRMWFVGWDVPIEHRGYWRHSIEISVDDKLSYPAATWGMDNKRYLSVRPEYLNAGVLAHEQAHNSYSMLADPAGFAQTYHKVKSHKLIKLLFSKNKYGLTSDVEAHAEIYRYLGQSMPEELKKFYPKLMEGV